MSDSFTPSLPSPGGRGFCPASPPSLRSPHRGRVPGHAVEGEPIESAANKTLTTKNVLNLSDRESEIMGWVCSGKTNDEIGSILDISTFTVKNHLQRIFKKIDVVNRSQAVAKILNQVT